MSGIVEDLRDQVTALQQALVKLCTKSGHADEKHWARCDIHRHRIDAQKYVTDPRHSTQCSICGEFACVREAMNG